jgi:hypothetical protein
MKAALICKEMGWTYQEYCDSPQWFVTIVLSMFQNEAEEVNRKAKQ